MALASLVSLFKDMLGMAFFNPVSQLQEGYLLLRVSPFLQLSPDYLQKEIHLRFYFFFFFLEEAQRSLLLPCEREQCSLLSPISNRNKKQQQQLIEKH